MTLPPEAHEPIGAPDLPPLEQTRTYTGPIENDLAGVAARLAPTFGVEVEVVAAGGGGASARRSRCTWSEVAPRSSAT